MSTQQTTGPVERTVITDIDIPFWRLVAILIKWTFAAIPAAIIVWLIMMIVVGVIGSIFGLGWMMHRPSI
ncbi:MAG TPA: hypothetical protein VFC45_11550 [Pseudolabrys sp.]|nr:hypothetical protein [Pseudolabrys sp.]